MAKILPVNNQSGQLSGYRFFCPACKCTHIFTLDRWKFDGNFQEPTFTPSLLYYDPVPDGRGGHTKKTICHLIVTKGVINFCGDCPHELSGQRVPMIDCEDYV